MAEYLYLRFISLWIFIESINSKETIHSIDDSCQWNNTIYIEPSRIMKPSLKAKCLDITTINITEDQLVEFSPFINYLSANDIRLNKFPTKFLKYFPNMKIIDISRNEIKYLSRNLNTCTPNLKKLNLAENSIKIPKRGFLTKSKSLEVLILSKNKIRKLNSRLFNALPFLKVLYLDGNFLISLKVHPFRKLHHLELLHLGSNQLESIPFRALQKVSKHLRVIYKNNKMKF